MRRSSRAALTRSGRWGLAQEMDGSWESTGSLGYENQEDAEADAARCNAIQPGRWRVRDRRPREEIERAA